VSGVPQLLPIFPLDTVLLPGTPLPLHIFEPRYRALVADLWADGAARPDQPGFGIVALRRPGTADGVQGPGRHQRADPPPEPDSGDSSPDAASGSADSPATESVLAEPATLAMVGTLATIVEVEPYDDGRADLLTVGSRRFRLVELHSSGKPYLQANVEWLPEEAGPASGALMEAARVRCASYLAALARLAGRELPDVDFADEPMALSYQVASRMRLSNGERQALLEAPTAAERLRGTLRLLRREIVLLDRTHSVPVSPGVLRVESRPN
jgi:Lon protease-like protein